jgi:hypothetical protein
MPNENETNLTLSVKEISMVSNFVFMVDNEYWYSDLLRISKHWSSYRRTSVETEKVTDQWSYQSTDEFRERKWEQLVYAVLDLMKSEKQFPIKTDCPTFNIRITFDDGSHQDKHFFSDFKENHLEWLSTIFKRLIPSEEIAYPDVLNIIPLFLDSILLTPESIKQVNKSHLCALMFAEGGAMGSPGEVCILDTDGHKYVVESFYCRNEQQLSQIEAIETLFHTLDNGPRIGDVRRIKHTLDINHDKWIYLYLGMRNHLYLRQDFWHEHGLRVFDQEASIMYGKWKRLVEKTGQDKGA